MFTASRLTLARKRRGLSLVRLAELSGISTRSLSAYEKGEQRPGPGRVGVLARALAYPTPFFFGDAELDELAPAAVSFRAPSKLAASRRDAALSAGRLAIELHEWIVERFHLPEPGIPSLRRADPEAAAQEVRARFGLGSAPISNMVHLMEAHGVRVFSLPECAEVDAFSTVWRGTPFAFLCAGRSGERGRFDAAHELGHLVMHSGADAPQGMLAEQQANRFAAAFLMPRASVLAHLPPAPSIAQIMAAKRIWKVAAIALTHRLHEVGLLSEWLYRMTCIELGKLGYRRAERDGIPRESSQLLAKVLAELRREGVGLAEIAADLRLPVEEVSGFVFGPVAAEEVHGGDPGGDPGGAEPDEEGESGLAGGPAGWRAGERAGERTGAGDATEGDAEGDAPRDGRHDDQDGREPGRTRPPYLRLVK